MLRNVSRELWLQGLGFIRGRRRLASTLHHKKKSLKPPVCCDGRCIWGCVYFYIQTLLSHWSPLLLEARCAQDRFQKASASRAVGKQTMYSMASEGGYRCEIVDETVNVTGF